MTGNEYRKKHRRCAMCKYWNSGYYDCSCVGHCKVKNIRKRTNNGRFCKCYNPKEMCE